MKFRKNKETIEFENYKGRKCPFINEILSACHCTDMKSVRIEEAIYYCGANYRKCDIYKGLKKTDNIISPVSGNVQRENSGL